MVLTDEMWTYDSTHVTLQSYQLLQVPAGLQQPLENILDWYLICSAANTTQCNFELSFSSAGKALCVSGCACIWVWVSVRVCVYVCMCVCVYGCMGVCVLIIRHQIRSVGTPVTHTHSVWNYTYIFLTLSCVDFCFAFPFMLCNWLTNKPP